MALYRLTELQSYLNSLGRGSKRTLSQNFLVDGNIVKKILQYSRTLAGEVIVEIGPGPGVLTEAFLQQGVSVIAIELDNDFASTLMRLKNDPITSDLVVLTGDVLSFSFEEIRKQYIPKDQPMKIVSNIPYHLTKEIFQKIAHTCIHPFEALIMVQDEFAQKMTSSSSLLERELSFFGTLSYCGQVPKGCFFPKPTVDSALLSFKSHPPKIASAEMQQRFLTALSLSYQHRRKSISGVLEKECGYRREKIEEWLQCHGISSRCRPDDLTLDEWLKLFQAIHFS